MLLKEPSHLITELDAQVCAVEVSGRTVDKVLISSFDGNPEGGETDDRNGWLIIEDAMQTYITSSESTLDTSHSVTIDNFDKISD